MAQKIIEIINQLFWIFKIWFNAKDKPVNPIPKNRIAILFSVSPLKYKWCVVWSFPPTNGDLPDLIRLILTVIVSVIGKIKTKATVTNPSKIGFTENHELLINVKEFQQ